MLTRAEDTTCPVDISAKKVGLSYRARHVPKRLPLTDAHDCHPLPHVRGPTVSEYYEVIRLPRGLRLLPPL